MEMDVIMSKELQEALRCIEKEKPILFCSQILTDKIRDLFYTNDNYFENNEIEYFTLTDYCVLTNDMIIGLKYYVNHECYYLMMGSNSFFAPIEQMAVGKAKDGNIFMIQENIMLPGMINFISFPEKSINVQTEGFIPKSFRDSLSYEQASGIDGKSKICFENGLEAFNALKEIVNKYNKNDSNSDDFIKRKKMII